MNNKLFVGNLSYNVTEDELQQLFSQHGGVVSAVLPKDRDTGRLRGFGFVEMETQAAAEAAIKSLDGRDFSGRPLKVNMSTPKPRNNGSRY
ncbi:MAG: RNA-binding protein [Candidatus Obscuribacterales bacterium]|jgi:RNA recognition motif-containing protein